MEGTMKNLIWDSQSSSLFDIGMCDEFLLLV